MPLNHTEDSSVAIDEEVVRQVLNQILNLQPQFFRNVTLNFNKESALYDTFVKMIARGLEQKAREEILDTRQSMLPGITVE